MAKKKAAQHENGSITQADAVRQALASGVESSKAGMKFIKEKFGLSIKPQAYYSYKSQILKQNGGRPSSTTKAVPARGNPTATPAAKRINTKNDLSDLRAIKGFVDKYGAEHVKEMVELFQ